MTHNEHHEASMGNTPLQMHYASCCASLSEVHTGSANADSAASKQNDVMMWAGHAPLHDNSYSNFKHKTVHFGEGVQFAKAPLVLATPRQATNRRQHTVPQVFAVSVRSVTTTK